MRSYGIQVPNPKTDILKKEKLDTQSGEDSYAKTKAEISKAAASQGTPSIASIYWNLQESIKLPSLDP